MKQDLPASEQYVKGPRKSVAPLEVFYVVQTTGTVLGKRHHRVRSLLYETRRQAQAELLQLGAANAGADSYSVWKSATYIEPADWMTDVVMNDGTMIRPKRRNTRPIGDLPGS
jgi:hypothetical protein